MKGRRHRLGPRYIEELKSQSIITRCQSRARQAMQSSKRKFQTLLNGLGARPTSSLDEEVNNGSQTALLGRKEHDTPSKKFRTGRPVSPRPLTSSRASNNMMPHRKSASVATETLSKHKQGPPVPIEDHERIYNPYDRDAFLVRLKTFSKVLDWSDKPARVDSHEWARRGWVCKKNEKSERVRCDYCFVEIVVKINVKDVNGVEERVYVASNIEDALVDKYAAMITTAHAESCPWKVRGCGETIFHLTLNNAPITLKGLRIRYDTLSAMSDKLPYMHNMHAHDNYNLDEILSYLPSDFFQPSADPFIDGLPAINRVAIFMALCGWHGDPSFNAEYGTASCSSCFRNLGLWMFKSKKVDEHGQRIEGAMIEHLDPIAEHRDYCPWKSGRSQSGPAKKSAEPLLAAWEVIIRVLKSHDYLSKTANNAALPRNSMTAMSSQTTSASVTELSHEEDEKVRDEKDKQRRGRLSRIKSLFDVKGGNKLQRNPVAESKEAPI